MEGRAAPVQNKSTFFFERERKIRKLRTRLLKDSSFFFGLQLISSPEFFKIWGQDMKEQANTIIDILNSPTITEYEKPLVLKHVFQSTETTKGKAHTHLMIVFENPINWINYKGKKQNGVIYRILSKHKTWNNALRKEHGLTIVLGRYTQKVISYITKAPNSIIEIDSETNTAVLSKDDLVEIAQDPERIFKTVLLDGPNAMEVDIVPDIPKEEIETIGNHFINNSPRNIPCSWFDDVKAIGLFKFLFKCPTKQLFIRGLNGKGLTSFTHEKFASWVYAHTATQMPFWKSQKNPFKQNQNSLFDFTKIIKTIQNWFYTDYEKETALCLYGRSNAGKTHLLNTLFPWKNSSNSILDHSFQVVICNTTSEFQPSQALSPTTDFLVFDDVIPTKPASLKRLQDIISNAAPLNAKYIDIPATQKICRIIISSSTILGATLDTEDQIQFDKRICRINLPFLEQDIKPLRDQFLMSDQIDPVSYTWLLHFLMMNDFSGTLEQAFDYFFSSDEDEANL